MHSHEQAEEYYLLVRGELDLLVAGTLVTLKPWEMLMVRPQVPHAVVAGAGLIEHFGIRAPASRDKVDAGEIPQSLPVATQPQDRELRCDWGCRVPLQAARNQNCWLFGFGSARFPSAQLTFAYLSFPTAESANAGIGTRHRLHLHTDSWEYYVVLEGTKTLQVGDELVEIMPGEILEVPSLVKHTLRARLAPYKGVTIRVPGGLDDKVDC
jgi:mannose-6-phosphate isomerase-like protein (cupin superfamily)